MGSLLRLFGYTPEISIFAVSFGIADREGLDSAFMDWCAEQLRGKEIISPDEAHRILSTCSGSLAHDIHDIIDDRSHR